jgi:mono/diheme cytochrome c family protein
MMRKQPHVWTVAIALTLLVGALAGASAARADDPPGQVAFLAQKCDMCHSVSTAGIEAKTKSEAMRGPDLVDLDVEADWLTKFLKKEVEKDGKTHKKSFTGSDEELKALVDWLLEQKSE